MVTDCASKNKVESNWEHTIGRPLSWLAAPPTLLPGFLKGDPAFLLCVLTTMHCASTLPI